ncbi:MAG TPA: LysR family transcriptional regulator [Ramlibacter sp.]|uniref:LysR family transcriptional regulator n=1 Tax=Ramlibacter sp. TaxID=1917967 RepID=UPI002C902905|nr:LysR family transcriptional regulator [Ramlibacter sp.]HVZ42216.1 LysR family transcriptional regulator [Ramlibacter sp.]
MNQNLTGRAIEAFIALEETRRFALAAKRCHVSPSTFSQMISRLEDQVGARLFDRDTRNVSLTPEGEVFSHGAHRIAAEIRASIEELVDRASHRKGRVTVAATPSLSADWLPQRLAEFRDRFPDIELRMHDVTTVRCLEMIRRGDADFSICAQPGPEAEFDNVLLFQERYHILCASSDPLAKQKEAKIADLRNRSFVHMVRTGSVRQQMMPLLATAQVSDSGLEVANFGTVAGLVAAGFGISIVPEHAVRLCHRPGLVAIPVQSPKAVRPVTMLRRKGRSMSVAAEALWSQLEDRKRRNER